MDICLRQIKKLQVSPANINGNSQNEVSGIDQNFFEEQINSLNFSINKV